MGNGRIYDVVTLLKASLLEIPSQLGIHLPPNQCPPTVIEIFAQAASCFVVAAKVFPSSPSRILDSIISPNARLARPRSPLLDLLVLLSPALHPLRISPLKGRRRVSIGSWMCFNEDVITTVVCQFRLSCGMDIVEVKSLGSIIGRQTTSFVIGIRSNNLWF